MPTEKDIINGITASNFNYTPVILAIFFIIALVYWNLPAPYGAKHFYHGPKRKDDSYEIENENQPLN